MARHFYFCIFALAIIFPLESCNRVFHRYPVQTSYKSILDVQANHPEEVKSVDLGSALINRRRIPNAILKLSNLESLSLRTPVRSAARTANSCSIRFLPSNLRSFPPKIGTLQKLRTINFIGCSRFKYVQELPKLTEIASLETVSIEMFLVTPSVVDKLSSLKQLDSLCIYYSPIPDSAAHAQILEFQRLRPDCVVEMLW